MKCLLKGKVDILTITGSKLNSSFRAAQFLIDGYSKPFRFDHGTIIRTGITCKKIPCCMRNSACSWFIVKKAKIF